MSSNINSKNMQKEIECLQEKEVIIPQLENKTLVCCLVCGVTFPNQKKCIKEHCKGASHVENIRSMGYHGISFKNNALHCRVCKITLDPEDDLQRHIACRAHEDWMLEMDRLARGQFIHYSDYLAMKSDYASCKLCLCDIKCDVPSIKKHINSDDHKYEPIKWSKKRSGMVVIEDKLWCKLCKVLIDNKLDVLVDHVDNSDSHVQWLKLVNKMIQDEGITIDRFLTEETEENAYCEPCNVNILCEPVRIECHIHTERHEFLA